MLDDVVAELGALAEGAAGHEAFEVVGDGLGGDGALDALDDQVGGFVPAEVAEHELAREDDRAGVDLVLAGVLGGGAVGGFEDGVAGVVVDVGAGGDADAADAGGEGVGDVVAVEVHGGNNVVLGGAGEDLLEEGVGDDVLDDDLGRIDPGLAVVGGDVGDLGGVLRAVDGEPGAAVEFGRAVVVLGDLVTPLHEGTLGVLHDVALVDEGDGGAAVGDGVVDGGLDEALGALLADGLDAEAAGLGEAELLVAGLEVLLEELAELFAVLGAVLELDAGVDVLGVLAEDDHVGQFGGLDGGRDAVEVADGAEAGVEVQDLAEGDVEGADAAAGGRGEGALDADEVGAEVLEGLFGEPVAGGVEGFLAGRDFVPGDLLLAVVGLLDGGVEDLDGGVPDVGAGAVTLDEGDDGIGGDLEALVGHGDGGSAGGGGHFEAPNGNWGSWGILRGSVGRDEGTQARRHGGLGCGG